jgi:predicted metal-dependent hydrolase
MHDSGMRRGLALFNSAHFFDAHEALEDVWREAPRHSHRRRHLQGLVQLAVAFHHQSTGNLVGARSVLERALRNVEGAEESFPEVDWKRLRTNLKPWREYLAEARRRPGAPSPPDLPKVLLHHPAR